eukprot:CAMPEP_0119300784 /NCGR_PEP_ID=MMETSP1333-20130426/2689_1 /TAXON_ID=418940 /ORGANISM="Scyphosphaera apsteinii, Strain RCC1455" /LENGTH=454 /DNA_ID=CAMNT_0007302681 /DNA_START=187 /DNA_END=1551 /DNA_ORIENTATION=-
MYLQRHVVSFTISQVATEVQLITLLDNLKCVTDDPRKPDLDMSYEDILFVIEEIDTDPRGIFLQRPEPEDETVDEQPPAPVSRQGTGSQSDPEGGGAPARKTKRELMNEKEAKEKEEQAKREPPLSLGLLLRQLDGGSEAPGRVIIMTTNREELLDAAFKRPGRVKKVRLDNLAYNEFKQMVLHFRRAQGALPTAELWTKPIDEMAQMLVDDFALLQERRISDLDRRGLGLSPAMLEEVCLESRSLSELFHALRDELLVQWKKAQVDGEPPSSCAISRWNWRLHSLRVAVLHHLSSRALADARIEWPERVLLTDGDDAAEDDEVEALSEVEHVVLQMVEDEGTLNDALEYCRHDYSHMERFAALQYRVQLELGEPLEEVGKQNLRNEIKPPTLLDGVGALLSELEGKWCTARETEDEEILDACNGERPPAAELFDEWAARWDTRRSNLSTLSGS